MLGGDCDAVYSYACHYVPTSKMERERERRRGGRRATEGRRGEEGEEEKEQGEEKSVWWMN